MSLDQNEIQELLALFPNGKHVIERFTQSQESIDALEKLDDKIDQLKAELAGLKVKQTESRNAFSNTVKNFLTLFPENSSDISPAAMASHPVLSLIGGSIAAAGIASSVVTETLKGAPLFGTVIKSVENELYSQMGSFLAENGLSQLSVDALVTDDGVLLESREETKQIILDAWLENYNDRRVKILEHKISDLQKLRASLAVQ